MLVEVPLTLEWWQTLVAILGVLGLSPAPWLLGLATGRLQFTTPADRVYEARAAELAKHHDEIQAMHLSRYEDMKRSRDGWREAVEVERTRADRATATATEAMEAIKVANHFYEAFTQVTQEVKP